MIDAARPGQTTATPRPAGELIEPFLFGDDTSPLYGCLHRPAARSSRNCGVLLCQPIGPEYIRSHRAMRQLAGRLSRAGFAVMRFDFFGCGDSAGDDEQGDVTRWIRDVNAAVDELRTRTDPDEVVVIGLRLGGSLAALAGAERKGIDKLVLWDPVVNGAEHLSELRRRHQKQLEFLPTRAARRLSNEGDCETQAEFLGFRFGPEFLKSLTAVDLKAILQRPAKKCLVIESSTSPIAEELAMRWQNVPGTISQETVEYQHVPDHEIWMAAPDRAVVPGQVLQSIISWVSRSA